MNQYEFENVLFAPMAAEKLKIDGEHVHLPKRLVNLLEYMLINAGKTIPINTILDDVWGKGQHTQNAFNVALSDLHEILPDHIRIRNIHRQGYVFDHQIKIKKWRFAKLEQILENSQRLNQLIRQSLYAICTLATMGLLLTISHLYNQSNVQRYELENTKPLFTWDYTTGTPQVSPDGKYLAYRLSSEPFSQDYLGIVDLTLGDTQKLVPMGFDDGFRWDLSGNRIVYQDTTSGNCEIRLLTFGTTKSQYQSELLTPCANNSGVLSFAWFNENEFYVNLTETDKITSPNGFVFHQLYSFNINTKQRNRLKVADYQGGVGFFSLEYDPISKALYFLQSNHFQTTDFYRFVNNTITKLHTVDFEVADFTVYDNKLIYKNKRQQFIMNNPADHFGNPQTLLRPQYTPIFEPQLAGQKFAYVIGLYTAYSLHQLKNNKLAKVDIQNLEAKLFANFNHQLVFTSRQTGINQIYIKTATGEIKKLSHMTIDEHISHIDISDNMLAISYLERVDIYYITAEQIEHLHSFAGFNYGVFNQNNTKILLKSISNQGEGHIIEKQLADLTSTGVTIKEAKLAFYHQGEIVYLRNDNVLIRFKGGIHQPIASNINVDKVKYVSFQNDEFYYITANSPKNLLTKINLVTGNKIQIPTGDINPIRTQKVGQSLYIRSRDNLTPTLMIGDLILSE